MRRLDLPGQTSRENRTGTGFSKAHVMNLRAIGVVHRVSTEIVGHLNRDTSLRSFLFVIDSGMVRFEARGRVEGNLLVLKTGFGGETTESKVSLRSPLFLAPGLWPYLLKQGLNVGARYRLSLFDPSIMAEKAAEVEVLAREEVVIDGRTWDAYKVKTSFSGLETLSLDWLRWGAPKRRRFDGLSDGQNHGGEGPIGDTSRA